jgi:hypothetical protein
MGYGAEGRKRFAGSAVHGACNMYRHSQHARRRTMIQKMRAVSADAFGGLRAR